MSDITINRTRSAWETKNPVLPSSVPGFESDTGKLKIGNGTDRWSDLPYQDTPPYVLPQRGLFGDGLASPRIRLYRDESGTRQAASHGEWDMIILNAASITGKEGFFEVLKDQPSLAWEGGTKRSDLVRVKQRGLYLAEMSAIFDGGGAGQYYVAMSSSQTNSWEDNVILAEHQVDSSSGLYASPGRMFTLTLEADVVVGLILSPTLLGPPESRTNIIGSSNGATTSLTLTRLSD